MSSKPNMPKQQPPIVMSQTDIAQGQDELINRLAKLRAGSEGLKNVPYGMLSMANIGKTKLGD